MGAQARVHIEDVNKTFLKWTWELWASGDLCYSGYWGYGAVLHFKATPLPNFLRIFCMFCGLLHFTWLSNRMAVNKYWLNVSGGGLAVHRVWTVLSRQVLDRDAIQITVLIAPSCCTSFRYLLWSKRYKQRKFILFHALPVFKTHRILQKTFLL